MKLQKVQEDKKALLTLRGEDGPKSNMEEQLDMIESTLNRYIKRVEHYISEAELKKLQSTNSKKHSKKPVMATASPEAIKSVAKNRQPLNGAFVTGNLDHVDEL